MLGNCKDFVFSDISGVKNVAKAGDMLGNLEVFVLGVGCWGVLVEGGEIQKMRISCITNLYG